MQWFGRCNSEKIRNDDISNEIYAFSGMLTKPKRGKYGLLKILNYKILYLKAIPNKRRGKKNMYLQLNTNHSDLALVVQPVKYQDLRTPQTTQH